MDLQIIKTVQAGVLSTVVTDLPPYSEEIFIVEACNNVGCVNSSESTGKTLAGGKYYMKLPLINVIICYHFIHHPVVNKLPFFSNVKYWYHPYITNNICNKIKLLFLPYIILFNFYYIILLHQV